MDVNSTITDGSTIIDSTITDVLTIIDSTITDVSTIIDSTVTDVLCANINLTDIIEGTCATETVAAMTRCVRTKSTCIPFFGCGKICKRTRLKSGL